jgi:hypothetical protein
MVVERLLLSTEDGVEVSLFFIASSSPFFLERWF